MRKVFLDLGANVGSISEEFGLEHPDYELIAVEPNIDLLPAIHSKSLKLCRPVSVIWGAAWINNGSINLFMSGHDLASTVVAGKREYTEYGWPQIDYNAPNQVPALDLSSFLINNFTSGDHIVIKMDIEGAEYEVLEKMLKDGSVDLISELRCEWHIDRFPEMPKSRHDAVVAQVAQRTKLGIWL
jgi:FkbM family methyltransferase